MKLENELLDKLVELDDGELMAVVGGTSMTDPVYTEANKAVSTADETTNFDEAGKAVKQIGEGIVKIGEAVGKFGDAIGSAGGVVTA